MSFSRKSARFSAVATTLLGALFACGDSEVVAPSSASPFVSIQAYTTSGATRAPSGTATGTLIADRLVLTAGHICAGKSSWAISTKEGAVVAGVRGMTYDWRNYRSNKSQPARSDVCLIELDGAIELTAYPTVATAPVAGATSLSRARHRLVGGARVGTEVDTVASVVTSAADKGFARNYVTNLESGEPTDTGGAVFDAATNTVYGVVSGKGLTSGLLHVARTDDAVGDGWIRAHVRRASRGPVAPGGSASDAANPVPPSYCWGTGCADVARPVTSAPPSGAGEPSGNGGSGASAGGGPGFPGAGGGAGGLPGGVLECFYPTGGASGPPAAAADYVLETFNGVQTVHIRITFNPTFVDNTYGANAVEWPKKGHTFKDLVGSDHVELTLLDKAGAEKLQFKLDYISVSAAGSSGYASLGVRGGDGKMLSGDPNMIVSARTSLERNLNERGYGTFLVDSPATTAAYGPNAAAPNWDYRVVYETWVQTSAFGAAGFGSAQMSSVHASPSKAASNTLIVEKKPCPPEWNGGGGGGSSGGTSGGTSGGSSGGTSGGSSGGTSGGSSGGDGGMPGADGGGGGTSGGGTSGGGTTGGGSGGGTTGGGSGGGTSGGGTGGGGGGGGGDCEGPECGGCPEESTTCVDETIDYGDCDCTPPVTSGPLR